MATVKIKDIAARLGISSATVSMALNDRPGVNAQTKQRVLDLVKELNYTGTATKKTPQNKGIISFLVYKKFGKIIAETQFFADLTEAVEKAARSYDYTLTLTYCTEKEHLSDVVKSILTTQPEGILVLGTEMTEQDFAVLEGLNIPMVVLDNGLMGCDVDTVTIRNDDGIFRAVKYLYEQGHRDIGYLRSSCAIKNFEERRLAFKYSLQQFGLTYKVENTMMIEPTIEGACKDICTLIEENIKFPKAIIADNDLIAIGALRGFLQNGIKIPDDISLIGFDDIPMASLFEPALTTVRVSRKDLGYCAVNQLVWRINHLSALPRCISLGTTLTVRRSVKTIK